MEISVFLKRDKAEGLYNEIYSLAERDMLSLMTDSMPGFQYSIHTAYENRDSFFRCQYYMTQLHEILNSKIIRNWLKGASGIYTLDNRTITLISYYKAMVRIKHFKITTPCSDLYMHIACFVYYRIMS